MPRTVAQLEFGTRNLSDLARSGDAEVPEQIRAEIRTEHASPIRKHHVRMRELESRGGKGGVCVHGGELNRDCEFICFLQVSVATDVGCGGALVICDENYFVRFANDGDVVCEAEINGVGCIDGLLGGGGEEKLGEAAGFGVFVCGV